MQSGIARLRKALSSIASDDLKIVVLREGKASLRQYEVRGKILAIVLLITLVALPVTYYIGAHLLLETAHSHRVARLRSDNARMKTMVYNFENRIKSLEQQIVSLSAMDEDLRAHAELPGIPNEIRRVGIGGGILDPSADIDYLLPGSDVSLAALSGKLDALTRGLKLEQISYEEIRDELKNDLSRLLRTPSVRPLTGGETNGRAARFGPRRHPITNAIDFHNGMDISVDSGTPVISTADGKVVATRYDPNLGLYVKIDHGNGYETLYGHLRRISIEQGQVVKRGDVVGLSGNTGRSTAPHLHYEVRHYRQPQNPVNFF